MASQSKLYRQTRVDLGWLVAVESLCQSLLEGMHEAEQRGEVCRLPNHNVLRLNRNLILPYHLQAPVQFLAALT